jgi:hypothetical protein
MDWASIRGSSSHPSPAMDRPAVCSQHPAQEGLVDKRYQVFISSTFKDLLEERQAVLKAVLELDHMPAGMELFPATDDSAWRLIQDVIDASDYYVVVVGGRYGSVDEAGIGYTEREYDYAYQLGRPVIPLLHKEPGKLSRDNTETNSESWNKLVAFRAKLENRHTCSYWTNADDLKARAIVGLTAAVKRYPAAGWVRADAIPTGATIAEVLKLRNRVAELDAQLAAARFAPPPGAEDLHQGDDSVEVPVTFTVRAPGTYDDTRYTATITVSWNEVFGAVAPTMIDETSDQELRVAFEQFFNTRARSEFLKSKDIKGKSWRGTQVSKAAIDDFIIQFRALGLMKASGRPRSVKDTRTHWALTSYGDNLMTQLRASRRTPVAAASSEATPVPESAEGSPSRRRRGGRQAPA